MISHRIFLKMRNVLDRFLEKIKTHILCSITFFPENRAACERMWKKYGIAKQATDDNIIQRMRFACWITARKKYRIFNTYCFSTTAVVTRTRRSVIFKRKLPV